MDFLNNVQQEQISLTSVIHYIEYRFEMEFKAVSNFIDFELDLDNAYDNNASIMTKLKECCNNRINANINLYSKEEALPNWIKKIDMREPAGAIINFCIDRIEEGTPCSIDDLKSEIEQANANMGEIYFIFTDEQLIDIIRSAYIIVNNRRNVDLYQQDEQLELLKTSIKLVDVSSHSNIFRQSFINIMSIFDAFVFDCLKKYFSDNPTELDNFFDNKPNDKVKIILDDVLSALSINDLKNEIINRQFEGKYLSEIVKKLNKHYPNVFVDVEYEKIMEIIERRNVHLHNKGIADEKYCSHYNIYKKKVGEFLFIDSEYLFMTVFNLTSKFSSNLQAFISR